MPNRFTFKNSKLAQVPRLGAVLEKILCVSKINYLFDGLRENKDVVSTFSHVLQQLDIKLNFRAADLANVPKTGPVIVVANHPTGVLDGLALAYLMLQVRPDVKILANYLLKSASHLNTLIIGVDPFASKKVPLQNIAAMKEAEHWLSTGGLLGIFPGSSVSHWQFKTWDVTDPTWHESCISLATMHNATVVPVYFDSKNSWYFQLAGMVSPYLRTLLLPQQFFAKQHQTMNVAIGLPIYPVELNELTGRKQKSLYLRNRTYLLAYHRQQAKTAIEQPSYSNPMATPIANHLLREDLQKLPSSACLFEHGEFSVYLVGAQEIPHILPELGRLRELTFRQAGEGTGNTRDLDRFDKYYLHLFVWHKARNMIIAGTRIGLTDLILPEFGPEGMYTSTLFNISPKLLEFINPALEPGRTFVISEYQKKPLTFFFLLKGVFLYAAKNPRYKNIYGAVSISQTYQKISRDLMVYHLLKHYTEPNLAAMVTAKSHCIGSKKKLPPIIENLAEQCNSLQMLDGLVTELEHDHKGVPVLFKHYLGLPSSVLGFNIDCTFSNCLDCLCLCQIKDISLRKLAHFMGDELEHYLKFRSKGEA